MQVHILFVCEVEQINIQLISSSSSFFIWVEIDWFLALWIWLCLKSLFLCWRWFTHDSSLFILVLVDLNCFCITPMKHKRYKKIRYVNLLLELLKLDQSCSVYYLHFVELTEARAWATKRSIAVQFCYVENGISFNFGVFFFLFPRVFFGSSSSVSFCSLK